MMIPRYMAALTFVVGVFAGGTIAALTYEQHLRLQHRADAAAPSGSSAPVAQPPKALRPKAPGERTWNELVAWCRAMDGTLSHDVTDDEVPECLVGSVRSVRP